MFFSLRRNINKRDVRNEVMQSGGGGRVESLDAVARSPVASGGKDTGSSRAHCSSNINSDSSYFLLHAIDHTHAPL